MLNETVTLNKNYYTCAIESSTTFQSEEPPAPIFNYNANETQKKTITDREQKIQELEEKLVMLKEEKGDRKKNRILSGFLTSLLTSSYLLGAACEKNTPLKDTPEFLIKLEKISRKIKKPLLNNLFVAGTGLASLAAISGLFIATFLILGNDDDKRDYNLIKQELTLEKNKLTEEKSKLAEINNEQEPVT